jgi:hypothetical protein
VSEAESERRKVSYSDPILRWGAEHSGRGGWLVRGLAKVYNASDFYRVRTKRYVSLKAYDLGRNRNMPLRVGHVQEIV